MAWKTKLSFGPGNLPGNAERLEALTQARGYLSAIGVDSKTVEEAVAHEKYHLFAFPDFEVRTGKKLQLVLQEDANEGIRLAVVPNRLHTRNDVRRSVDAVDDPSEGDLSYGCFNRFRKR